MRQLTATTKIRIKTIRTPLTGDTRIRLRQIKDLADWKQKLIVDEEDPPGTINHWKSDDKDHRKQSDGSWPVAGSEQDKIGKKTPEKPQVVNPGEELPLNIKATKQQLDNLQEIALKPHNFSEEQLKNIYKELPPGENKKDGTKAEFVNTSFGKIIRHNNPMIKKIIPQLKEIFDNSIPLYDSNYISTGTRGDGSKHKEHSNFEGYHNYLGKVTDGKDEYYVRMTLQELHTKPGKPAKNQFHSAFVSDIQLYKKEAANHRKHLDNNQATNGRGVDLILAQALNKINSNITSDGFITLVKFQ